MGSLRDTANTSLNNRSKPSLSFIYALMCLLLDFFLRGICTRATLKRGLVISLFLNQYEAEGSGKLHGPDALYPSGLKLFGYLAGLQGWPLIRCGCGVLGGGNSRANSMTGQGHGQQQSEDKAYGVSATKSGKVDCVSERIPLLEKISL
jgi:hypothetical protein